MVKSLTPFGEAGIKQFRERLNHPELNGLEVSLMREWEQLNIHTSRSPVVAIARSVYESDGPIGQSLLAADYWYGFIAPPLRDMISSVVQWSGSHIGSSHYRELVARQCTTGEKIRAYWRHPHRTDELPRLLAMLLHECSPCCGQRQFSLTMWGFGFQYGCHLEESPERFHCIFYHTLEWLLSPEGKAFYDRSEHAFRAERAEMEIHKRRAYRLFTGWLRFMQNA